MVKLIASSPLAGLVPVTIGAARIEDARPGAITLVAPLKGQADAVSNTLIAATGIGFPQPTQNLTADNARALWVGGGQALVFGDLPDLAGLAAMTEQSDAFAFVSLTGTAAVDVLARLVPVDVRPSQFGLGQTARTLVGHMAASLTPIEAGFEIMVMRSMAGTLVHDLERAARGIAGRRLFVE